MTIRPYNDLNVAILASAHHLRNTGQIQDVERWQGITAPKPMFECFDVAWKAPMPESIDELSGLVLPNLPWAEDHFQERIGGIPLNPPPSHLNWPFGQKANAKFTKQEKFDHTYPERFWPKQAFDKSSGVTSYTPTGNIFGIRFQYGDYTDILELLARDPSTRQAYLPIFFPEDTGAVHKGRVPCTLGYLFYMRNGYFHMSYHIRACDMKRHFRDDIYMAVRLAQHTLRLMQVRASNWRNVKMGMLTFHADNFHVFAGEEKTL